MYFTNLTSEALLILQAPAKINLALTIRSRREDGFHNLDTVFQTIDFYDDLAFYLSDQPACEIILSEQSCYIGSEMSLGEDNLIAKAWRQMAMEFPGRIGGVRIELTKRIPLGGGLGGGSSDAAAVIVGLNHIFKLGLNTEALEKLASKLGSDCACFIRGGTALGEGRGEILTPLKNACAPWLTLIYPGVHCSTVEAYKQVTSLLWEDGIAVKSVCKALEVGDIDTLCRNMRNVFHDLLMIHDPRFAILRDAMVNEGLQGVMLCGSGATMFGIAYDEVHAKSTASKLCKQLIADGIFDKVIAFTTHFRPYGVM